MALVDVVIPCYRYGRFLSACVESVLGQSLRDVRVLIIDDASPDETAAVARRLAEKDPRVTVLSHDRNLGHIATYNEGIAWATAPYFLLLSADDLLAPAALERAVRVMDAHPEVAFTYGGAIDLTPGDVPALAPSGEPNWRIRPGVELVLDMCRNVGNPVVTATAVVRTAVQKTIGGYRPELPHTGDLEMWLRFATQGAVADTVAVQAGRRLHGQNMSNAVYLEVVKDYLQRQMAFELFFAGAGAGLAEVPRLRRGVRRRLAEQAYWTGVAQRCRGNTLVGRQLMRFAWRLSPFMHVLPPVGALLRMESAGRKVASVLGAVGARLARTPLIR